jgi:tRNA pseudouridine55 synthase
MRLILNHKIRNAIDGILLLNKPLDLTSNAALQRVKRLYGAAKAGHTGSLDPLATGMLPICLGEATKFSQYVLDSDKTYRATGLLGIKTTTGDAAGEVISKTDSFQVTENDLLQVFAQFHGETLQTPSMFSALKHQGVPLYRYARQGVEIERAARPINVHALKLIQFDGTQFDIEVSCSKGTYIRNLVEDIGDALGVGAHVTALHRLYTAGYLNNRMYGLDELGEMSEAQRLDCLLPIDTPVCDLRAQVLSLEDAVGLRQGKELNTHVGTAGESVRLYDENGLFMGLGIWLSDTVLRAKRLVQLNV